MNKFRQKGKTLLIIIAFVFALLSGMATVNSSVYADASDKNVVAKSDIQQISSELFGDISVKSSEYLYNLDESPDFIYVEFENSGYAVYSSQTLDLLEYSLSGTLPYSTQAKKYYMGPTGYIKKLNNRFENLKTGESIAFIDAAIYAQQTRAVLTQAQTAKGRARQKNYESSNSSATGISEYGTSYNSDTESELPIESTDAKENQKIYEVSHR